MREWGYQCEVIAPSLIPIKPGVQRKHDGRLPSIAGRPTQHDATQLARLYSDLDAQRYGARHRTGRLASLRASKTALGVSRSRTHGAFQWKPREEELPTPASDRRSIESAQAGQPASVIAHAWKAQQRLHKRYTHLSYRKQPQIAVVAVARELVGFLWSVMQSMELSAPSAAVAAT